MNNKLIYVLVLSALGAGCGGDSAKGAGQQQYETVQEGSASGVTTAIAGPGETLPPLTGTNADTTTAFALDPNAVQPGQAGAADWTTDPAATVATGTSVPPTTSPSPVTPAPASSATSRATPSPAPARTTSPTPATTRRPAPPPQQAEPAPPREPEEIEEPTPPSATAPPPPPPTSTTTTDPPPTTTSPDTAPEEPPGRIDEDSGAEADGPGR